MPTADGETIGLGDSVKDAVSELEGIVECRAEWRFGCVRITFQPIGSKDGKPHEMVTQDEPSIILLAAGAAPTRATMQAGGADEPPHGPHDAPERHVDPK